MDVDTIRRICKREGFRIKSFEISNHALVTEHIEKPLKWQEIKLHLVAMADAFQGHSDFLISVAEMHLGDFVPIEVKILPGDLSAHVKYNVQ